MLCATLLVAFMQTMHGQTPPEIAQLETLSKSIKVPPGEILALLPKLPDAAGRQAAGNGSTNAADINLQMLMQMRNNGAGNSMPASADSHLSKLVNDLVSAAVSRAGTLPQADGALQVAHTQQQP